jgi:hypothetical protein
MISTEEDELRFSLGVGGAPVERTSTEEDELESSLRLGVAPDVDGTGGIDCEEVEELEPCKMLKKPCKPL